MWHAARFGILCTDSGIRFRSPDDSGTSPYPCIIVCSRRAGQCARSPATDAMVRDIRSAPAPDRDGSSQSGVISTSRGTHSTKIGAVCTGRASGALEEIQRALPSRRHAKQAALPEVGSGLWLVTGDMCRSGDARACLVNPMAPIHAAAFVADPARSGSALPLSPPG